eukprot:7710614-Pyramimonas_sp.AAC.1
MSAPPVLLVQLSFILAGARASVFLGVVAASTSTGALPNDRVAQPLGQPRVIPPHTQASGSQK